MRENFSDIKYMKRAYELAAKGRGKTSPNPMVGAVVVKNGKIISEGWHKKCGGPHAEVIALKKAGPAAKGAALYVTLEPCFHFGSTPPCVDQIIQCGIKRVFIGHQDPNPLTKGKSIRKLKKANIKVAVGLLEKELRRLNEAFLTVMIKGRPFVTAKIAQTLDGKIAAANGHSKWITSARTRAYAHRLRDNYDAIMVGIHTVLKDDPYLNGKRKAIKKIILDSTLKTPATARIFKESQKHQCIIVTTQKAPAKKVKMLEQKGAKIIVCAQKKGRVDLGGLLKILAGEALTHILIEGGAQTVGSALKEKLIDKMQIFVAPKIIGDQAALSSVQGLEIDNVNHAIKLDSVETKSIADDIVLEGYVKYRKR
ncbi:MAG: bifunctional diaminohydroxyphosphoribosylaminopyrimidine deaminase/5-amino-6-(5-phosphoribosylamino)uracil reductase RibD [Candidatus Omnitrophica bacterium]|nr:bifunctional diaminohydroxyphosphoribosylaminopyrimidine deaminase/5-amino-6-(5-phosphoribosylamino)uracil reductase RibD [Candidatus Omnitrophota bacterium]